MRARLKRVALGREREPALLPARGGSEGFLLAADVDARRVNFGVAAVLEGVEDGVVGVERGYASAFAFVGAGCCVLVGVMQKNEMREAHARRSSGRE